MVAWQVKTALTHSFAPVSSFLQGLELWEFLWCLLWGKGKVVVKEVGLLKGEIDEDWCWMGEYSAQNSLGCGVTKRGSSGGNAQFTTENYRAPFKVAEMVKNLPAIQETQVQSLDWEDPLEKGMATFSVFLPGEFHKEEPASTCVHGITQSQTWLSD